MAGEQIDSVARFQAAFASGDVELLRELVGESVSLLSSARYTADLFSVTGRVALVTGGSSGIGAMIAHGLHKAGAIVTIISRDGPTADLPFGHILADLGTPEGVNAAADAFLADHDRLHILVNAAGMHKAETIEVHDRPTWDAVVGLNLKQPFQLTQRLLGALKAHATDQRPSNVIHVASSGGLHVPGIENYAYSSSKAGLIHLAKHMARRLAPEHVTVNAIAPGPVPSRMFSNNPPEYLEKVAQSVPRGRLGEADDFVGVVIYLASRAGAYITGSVMSVDGGMVATL